MNTLPDSIQIGPMRYTVEFNQRIVDAANAYGRIEFKSQTISIDPDQSPDHLAITLLHEVLHGCWKQANAEGFDGDQEKIITGLALTLLDTMRRNPELVGFLMAKDSIRIDQYGNVLTNEE